MLSYLYIALVLVGCAAANEVQNACDGKEDGTIIQKACRIFSKCEGGAVKEMKCHEAGLVMNLETGECDKKENVAYPCSTDKDCTDVANGSFGDKLTNCTTYYTCLDGYFYGHQWCADGLAYDNRINNCNYIANVVCD